MKATAVARSNIALAKYWGKRAVPGNVPATPSLSITLAGLETRTTVSFDAALERDAFTLGGALVDGESLARVTRVLDEVRALAGFAHRARVESANDFPTASGLASSASGFAALVRAALAAAKVEPAPGGGALAAASRMARRASASAARSMFGGFVALGTGEGEGDDPAAVVVAPKEHWEIAVVVGAVTLAPKNVGSTSGMQHCRDTSPYFPAWVEDAPKLFAEVRRAVLARDLAALGAAAEASALRMHACMMASDPALLYFQPATMALLAEVRALRAQGVGAWATIDAGPHVKVITALADAPRVEAALQPRCARTLVAVPGDGAEVA